MTGDMFDAKTALELGLANQVELRRAELLEVTRKLAEKIAGKWPSRYARRKLRCAPQSHGKKTPACASNRRRSESSSAARTELRGTSASSRRLPAPCGKLRRKEGPAPPHGSIHQL